MGQGPTQKIHLHVTNNYSTFDLRVAHASVFKAVSDVRQLACLITG